jgi:hypothetical protein
VLVLADAAGQPVAVRGQPVDGDLVVVDFEGHRWPSRPVIPAHGRAGRSSTALAGYLRRAAQHDDLGAGVGVPTTLAQRDAGSSEQSASCAAASE